MVNVGIFYDHLDKFMAIWYNLWPFGIVCGHLLYYLVLVCLDQEKSGNPAAGLHFSRLKAVKELRNPSNKRAPVLPDGTDVYFHSKNTNLGILCRALEWKMLVYFMLLSILYYHLEHFMPIWYIL
jgi:hypothetical protein